MLTLLEILTAASALPPDDQESLIKKLRALQQVGSVRGQAPQDAVSPLYEALRQRLAVLGHRWPPYTQFLARSPHAKGFAVAEAALWEWLEPMFPSGNTSINKNSVAMWFADLAVPHIQGFRNLWAGVLITVREAPHVIDQDFPGYAQAGWLPFLIKARLQGGDHVRDEPAQQARIGQRTRVAGAGGVSHHSR